MKGEDYWRGRAASTGFCKHCDNEIFLIQHPITSHWYHFFNANAMCPDDTNMATPGGGEDLPLEMSDE